MAYVKQNFVNGQVLTADNMNHIEDGIAEVEAQIDNIDKRVTDIVNAVLEEALGGEY